MIPSINKLKVDAKCRQQYLIYTRRSTDDPENQKNSIEYQLELALKFAEREQIPLASSATIEMFCEKGIIKEHHSGFKESMFFEILPNGKVQQKVERPKFLVLADLLQKNYFKGVICLCWDRISRNEADDVIVKKLELQGVDIRFVQASYEKSSAGWLHKDVDGMFSRHYSRVISEKVKLTTAKLRAEGKCTYRSPVGYLDKGSGDKPLDPEKAPIVKRLFELYATGEWSYATLSMWANEQRLTTKPTRRQRTKKERLEGVPIESLKKVSKPMTPKSIEKILMNPFYIGKIIYKGTWIESKVHQPLINTTLFMKVRQIRKNRTVSVHYPTKVFTIYRGLLKCGDCGRSFSPYIKKGILYYRLKCKANCSNTQLNIKETYIHEKIKEVFSLLYFSEAELMEIERDAHIQLEKVSQRRNNSLEDAYRRLNKAMLDIDYIAKEKLTLLRTESMSMEEIVSEQERLKEVIAHQQIIIKANTESSQVMLDFVITFSNLLKGATEYFELSLDNEKRALLIAVFSELKLINGELKYVVKEGYNGLFQAKCASNGDSGDPQFLFSNLEQVYLAVKSVKPQLEKLLTLKSE